MPQQDKAYMTFWEHLETLRWHIIRSLVAMLLVSTIAFFCKNFVFHILILGPSRPNFWTYRILYKLGKLLDAPYLCITQSSLTLQNRHLAGQFTMHLLASIVIGVLGAFPYCIWELLRFIRPGVKLYNKYTVLGSTFLASLLLMFGIFIGYFIITPLVIQFLANYQIDPSITNNFDITSYVATVAKLVLACALLFQLPIVVYFLARAGMITPKRMCAYRKHATLAILILAAILTPPDVISQLLLAIPLIFVYEFSILITRLATKKIQ